jgi:hypothetical protein
MCGPLKAISPARLVPAIPENFRDWPACMQRRYREHALGASVASSRGAENLMDSSIRATKPTPGPVANARP